MLIPQLRIAQKVPLAIIGGALLVSAAVGVASYLVSASTMEAMSQERLRAISVERAERVTNFLDGLTEDVIQLANTALVQDNAKALATAWSQLDNPTQQLQQNFITDNPNPDERWLLDLPEQKNAYSFGHKNAHPGLRSVAQGRGYPDLFLFGLAPFQLDALHGRTRPARVEQLRREITGQDGRARPGSDDRGVARAGRDVQHPVPLAHAHRLDERAAELQQQVGGQPRVVARGPHRAVPGLQRAVGIGVGAGG